MIRHDRQRGRGPIEMVMMVGSLVAWNRQVVDRLLRHSSLREVSVLNISVCATGANINLTVLWQS
jgi:hypothetical protein